VRNQVQLIADIERLSGDGIATLAAWLRGPLARLFGGLHLGPKDHTQIDPTLGTWLDLPLLTGDFDVIADLIVNHVPLASPQCQDYIQQGDASRFAGMFLTLDTVFHEGACEAFLTRIQRPRPGLPFTSVPLASGKKRLLWTTFSPQQIDIDVHHPEAVAYLEAILEKFRLAGIRAIRLPAVGYAIKKAGTSCFMIPETYAFIGKLTEKAHEAGIEVLVEVRSHYRQQIEIAKKVDRIYDFVLPPLIHHALLSADTRYLTYWLSVSPPNSITVLDMHPGMDLSDVAASGAEGGLLPPAALARLVETIHHRSNDQSRNPSLARDNEYLIARVIQFFAPGIPQVDFKGLLAGVNDGEFLAAGGVASNPNLETNLHRPVVQALIRLIRFRNSHPAFVGELEIGPCPDTQLLLLRRDSGHYARLEVDLSAMKATIFYSSPDGQQIYPVCI
jgi:sucrose phosphorylase